MCSLSTTYDKYGEESRQQKPILLYLHPNFK